MDVKHIPPEIFERVIDGYSPDVCARLLALLDLRKIMESEGLGLKNRLIDWHYENVIREYEKWKQSAK